MDYKFIEKLRKKNNMTQEYLASQIEVSRPVYIQIEQGKRALSLSEAETLASVFNISLENFRKSKETTRKIVLENKPPQKDKLEIRINHKNLQKFKQVFLYILGEVGARPNVGETVLHKLLYFIDFDYYEKFEENLMGLTYIKNHHGPTATELGKIIKDMEKKGEIEAVKSKVYKYDQKKYLPLKESKLDAFSAREITHINDVLARLGNKNAKEIENYSHGDIPWKTALDGKIISYESVFYRDEVYSVRNYSDEL
jgi:transcriptional regulator with XRE-family HTH domain